MMHEENFRSRAQIVRQSARAHLLDIRRERLAKRGPRVAAELLADGLGGQVLPRQVVIDVAELPSAQMVMGAEAAAETSVPSEPEIEPFAEASLAFAEVTGVAQGSGVVAAEMTADTIEHDDLDEIAHKNVVAAEVPLAEKEPPLRLTRPMVPGPDRDLSAAGKPVVEKKAAKPKARKPMPEPSPADDLDDRAVRSAALADLAEGPKPVALSRPVALPDVLPTDLDDLAPFGIPPALMTEDDPEHGESAADLQSAEDAPAEGGAPSLAALDAAQPAPPELEAVAEVATLTETIPALPQSDLNSLPGAGPGLIWMLQQCDIHSLRDLACTEAADLVPKLGLVGQILNVDIWLDYARKAQAPQGE